MALTGGPDEPPTKSGLSLVDLSGGYVSAIAVLGGLTRARRDGVGCDCDISLFETALHELCYVGTWAASRRYVPPRRANSAHPSIVPFQNFATADGWMVVACPKQKFFEALCDALGRPELAADERFADFAARDRNRAELLEILDLAFAEHTTAEWLDRLAASGVPSAPVNDVLAALEDPQTAARGAVVETEHPALGTVRQVASPLRLGDEQPNRRAPRRGENTVAVLSEVCGYSPERLRALAEAAVFGDAYSIADATSAESSSS
jgi:crotonobetainyl-CoA:carnitine CoA-transferase CaiB-like acyl-CoA transferase